MWERCLGDAEMDNFEMVYDAVIRVPVSVRHLPTYPSGSILIQLGVESYGRDARRCRSMPNRNRCLRRRETVIQYMFVLLSICLPYRIPEVRSEK